MQFTGPFAAMWLICGIVGNTMATEASRFSSTKPTHLERAVFIAMGPVTLGIAIQANIDKP